MSTREKIFLGLLAALLIFGEYKRQQMLVAPRPCVEEATK
jgi:hypothetical protein